MAARAKYVTIMLVPDGTEARSGWRVRRWLLRGIVISLVAILVGIVLFFSFYGSVLRRAALTEQVMEENENLKRYYYKVQLLEQNLNKAREVVTRMTELAGIEYEFPALPEDSVLFAGMDQDEGAAVTRTGNRDWTLPGGLPIDGFISQRFAGHESDQSHSGIDIACAVGTPVLATGSGIVQEVKFDSTYGHVVILKHNDSVTTIYGHNDRILVSKGQEVLVGSRVALSGNSGRSTAPHLHYEIRIHGEPIDPLDNPYDEKE